MKKYFTATVENKMNRPQQVLSCKNAYMVFSHLRKKPVEEFWILALRADKSIIKKSCLFKGTVDSCPVHLRDIFRFACKQNASSILIAHNHPGQSHTPSKIDIQLTQKIFQAAELIGIPLEDHIIIGKESYSSLKSLRCLSK